MHAVRIIFVKVVLAALALCIVWQSRAVRREGHRLEKIERRAETVERQIQRCEAHISKLKSPQRIMRLVNSLGFDLAHPPTVQEVPEPQSETPLPHTIQTVDSSPQDN